MFQNEINLIAAQQNCAFTNRTAQLSRGLSQMVGEEREAWQIPAAPVDRLGALLDRWDAERLHPSSCNLRAVVLMRNGVVTGEKGLGQVHA